MNYTEDYEVLIDILFRLIESQAGEPIAQGQEWVNDSQTLSIKLFRHLVSMQAIVSGATFEKNALPVLACIDHSSIKVVARAALETYLVFFYIYGGGFNPTAEYRYRTWKLAGLLERQKFHASMEKNRAILAQEKVLIEELKSLVAQSEDFTLFSEKQQKRILSGEWRVGSAWSDLGKNAGFHEKYFKNIYSYLCGYSHSSYISALQVGQAQTLEEQYMLAESIMGIGIVIMAHFTDSYSSLYEPAGKVFSADQAAKIVVNRWQFGPENMAPIYDR